ncbi:MAG: MFS transporter [Chloroflexi bacterium]|nr:MFS transporter [Chloroflexota bacterium]
MIRLWQWVTYPFIQTKLLLPSTFAALRHPNYRLWFFGQTVSMMGTWMQNVAQGWLVYELTGSKFALGAISFIGTVPSLALMLPAGALSDRLPRHKVLMVTQSVMMVLAFILAFLAATGLLQVWHIGVLAFLLGVATSFDAPSRQALAVDMVEDRRDLMNAIALNSAIFNMARIIGPAIGGLVLALFGAAWCFFLNGVSFLAVIIALSRMKIPDVVQTSRGTKMLAQIAEGLNYVKDNRIVLVMISILAVSSLFGFSYYVLLPAFAVDVLHVGETGLGGLNAATGIGALLGSLIVASMGASHRKGMFISLGTLGLPITLLLFARTQSYTFALLWLALTGLSFMIQNSIMNTVIQAMVPDGLRGRVMAVYTFTFFGTAPLGALWAGTMAQALGPANAIAIGAVITLVFAVIVLVAVPALRRVET